MPKIKNLPIDQNIVASDKILVTDVNGASATKQMTIEALANYFSLTGKSDSAKDAFIYKIGTSITGDGQAKLLSNNLAASSINEITLSRKDANGVDRFFIFEYLEGSTIKMSVVDTNKDINYGVYVINTVSQVGSDQVRLVFDHEHGPTTAMFSNGNTIAISTIASGTDSGNPSPAQIRYGSGPPQDQGDDFGNNGDFYIDTDDEVLYGPKTNGTWPTEGTSLIGELSVGDITVNTGDAGTDADVEINITENVADFTFTIPKGDTGAQGIQGEKGDKGDTGSTGAAAGFGTPITNTIENDSEGLAQDATVTVDADSPNTAKVFTFGIPKGSKGDKGDPGALSSTSASATQVPEGGDPTATATLDSENESIAFAFGIPKGDTGNTGPTGATGAKGESVLNGTTDPTDFVDNDNPGTGRDGDFYINTTSNQIFGPRADGAWGTGKNLAGIMFAEVEIFYRGTSAPAAFPDTNTTFTFSEDSPFFDYTPPTGWTKNPETGDGSLYASYAQPTRRGYGDVTNAAWSTAIKIVDVDTAASIDVQDGGTTVGSATTLDFAGDNIEVTFSNGKATITHHGSSTPVDPADIDALTFTGFTSDQFPNVNQSVTITQPITANDETISQVVFSSTDNDAAQIDVTDTDSPYTTGAVTIRGGANAGDSVTVTAVTTHNEPGESNTTTTRTHTFSPVRTTKPGRVAFLSSPSGFAYTPAEHGSQHVIEAWDSGSFTNKTDYDTTDNNGWDVSSISDTNASVSVTAANKGTNFDHNVTATITQASTPDSSGGNEDKISETSYQINNDPTYHRIKSIRTGGYDGTAFTDDTAASTGLRTLSTFSSTTREIDFGTTDPDDARVKLANANGEYLYIIYDSSYNDLDLNLSQDDFGANLNEIADGFTKDQTIGGYKVYKSGTNNNAQTLLTEDYFVTLKTT